MSAARSSEAVKTEDLFRAHAPFVARLLSRLGVWSDELDDAVQEVFLVVHRNGGYLPGPASPKGYLASIAVRAASSHRRRSRTNRARRADFAPEHVSSTGQDPARSLETHESLTALQAALEELEPDLRATLVLAELEGESCKAIAASMQVPVGTVYWRLHRARKDFRLALETPGAGRRARRGGAPAAPVSAGARGEGRIEKVAAGAMAMGATPGGDWRAWLAAARSWSTHYDTIAGLERLQTLVRAGASLPVWAAGAAGSAAVAGFASSPGVVAPAILSTLVALHVAGGGILPDHAKEAGRLDPSSIAVASMMGTGSPAHRAPTRAALAGVPGAAGAGGAPDPSDSSDRPHAPAPDDESFAPIGFEPVSPVTLTSAAQPAFAHASLVGRGPTPSLTPPEPPDVAPAPVTENTPPEPAPGAPPAAAAPAAAAPPDVVGEMQTVASAERLLATDPAAALALARAGDRQFASGYLTEERRYVGVVALFELARVDEARPEAARFLVDYPDGPFTPRVRASLRRSGGR